MLEIANVGVALLITVLAGLSTTLGSLIAFFTKKPRHMCIAMGFAAGVMIFVSFVELLGTGITEIGYLPATAAFFVGIFGIMLIDWIVPHKYQEEESPEKGEMEKMGKMISFGIFIHNLPEGIITLFSALINPAMGLTVAIAVALHNIPEGVAVSLPIYRATGSKKKAFMYSFFSGMAEPLGAVICLLFLYSFITPTIIYASLALVGGIMVFISIDELLPFALKEKTRHNNYRHQHKIIFGIFLGMLVMAVSIGLLN
jgi:ZIP family zinc transporter